MYSNTFKGDLNYLKVIQSILSQPSLSQPGQIPHSAHRQELVGTNRAEDDDIPLLDDDMGGEPGATATATTTTTTTTTATTTTTTTTTTNDNNNDNDDIPLLDDDMGGEPGGLRLPASSLDVLII